MKRRPTTQDISWFLDLYRNKQLDLNPPYQRKSVWTTKDKRFFLDTIFRDYPCPAIFLHKTIDEKGLQLYHVVDGRQRLETIIAFVENLISIDREYGDKRLAGKKWSALEKNPELKKMFWDYVLSVEMLDTVEGLVVNEVFDRLNRNARKLERQELRHARFDGWFISLAEGEAEKEAWQQLGVVTSARSKRMKDVQFISELLLITLEGKVAGFDQDYLDDQYAKYDSLEELTEGISEDDFKKRLEATKAFLIDVDTANQCVAKYARGFGNFYSLWAIAALNTEKLPGAAAFATRYASFMEMVEHVAKQKDPEAFIAEPRRENFKEPYAYHRNSTGASTDLAPREERLKALKRGLGIA